MNILEILNESPESQKLGQLIAVSKKALKSLPEEARLAISEWEHANWDQGSLSNSYRNGSELIQIINKAFAPVKQKMHELFGDTITLHRGQRKLKGLEAADLDKALFSFSFDENVAKSFAHGRRLHKNIPSEDDIQKAVAQYEKTGFVAMFGAKYKRSKEYPDYYYIYDRHNNMVTDGNDLKRELTSKRNAMLEFNKEKESEGDVMTVEVPIDKIVWLTNNLNSKEFIVALNPLA